MSDKIAVNEVVEAAAGYAGNLYRGLENTVKFLREDNLFDGLSLLSEVISGLEWLTQAVSGFNELGGEYGGFDTETVSGFFSELVDAAENRDYVLLADLLEYEILPIIDEWGNKLDNILGI